MMPQHTMTIARRGRTIMIWRPGWSGGGWGRALILRTTHLVNNSAARSEFIGTVSIEGALIATLPCWARPSLFSPCSPSPDRDNSPLRDPSSTYAELGVEYLTRILVLAAPASSMLRQ